MDSVFAVYSADNSHSIRAMHEQQHCDLERNLSLAVEQIQEQFSRSSDAIIDSTPVTHLCQCVEDILQHGLKERFQNMRRAGYIATKILFDFSLLHWASLSEVTFWPLVLRVTCREAAEEITRLGLPSDMAKCQVWIRQAVRENTLGSYFNVISQDRKLLKEFYHPHAFLNNHSKVEAVKSLLDYGISSFDFDLSLLPSVEKNNFPEEQMLLCSDSSITPVPETKEVVNSQEFCSFNRSLTDKETPFPHANQNKQVETKKRKKKKKKKTTFVLIADGDVLSAEDQEEKPDNEKAEKRVEATEILDEHLEEEEFHDGVVNGKVSHTDQFTSKADTKIDEHELVPSSTRPDIVGNGRSNLASDGENASLLSPQRTPLGVKNGETRQMNKEPARLLNESKNEFRFNTIEAYLGVDGGLNVSPKTGPSLFTATSHSPGGNEFTDATNMERNKKVAENLITDNLSALGAEDMSVERQNKPELSGDREEFHSRGEVRRADFYSAFVEEDFNFVPGIHKQEDEISMSSSFNSFNGSGSFRNGRGDTFDSLKSRTSTANSEGMKVESGNCTSAVPVSSDAAESESGSRDDSLSDFVLFEELLGVDEDHFSPPESFMGVSTSEELHHSIQGCKDLIRGAPENSQEKRKLVEKLVMLRLRLQEAQETPVEEDSKVKKVLGHLFLKEEATSTNPHCDKCGKVIWTMWQSDFVCKDCRFHSHRKCLDMIRRPCASRKISDASYILRICPEAGLSSQQYKCAECRKRISLSKGDESEARLCDNTGQYFCVDCHWNDTLIIPARVIHNWDFTPRKVARQTKQLLDLMQHRPTLNVEKLNPTLLKYIGELREIKRLREEVLIMKKYFLSCQEARENKLLLKLQDRQHFVDSSELYSLQDLVDVNNGSLLPFLTRVHSLFLTHIKTECETCRGKGFLCEICKVDEVIFAFDPHALQCTGCKSVLHKTCFKSTSCPRCERRRQRSQKQPEGSRR